MVLSDVFMHSRVPHCTTFGAICGIMGLFVGCELVDWNYIWHSFPTPELQRYIMTHGERPPVAKDQDTTVIVV